MIDQDILTECGTTNERMREIFSAVMPEKSKLDKMKPEVQKAIKADVETRKKFEEQISSWIQEQVSLSLKNHNFYSAVDMAWDSVLNKYHIPLIMYAQGRIDVTAAANVLKDLPEGKTYVKKNEKGDPIGINLPKFCETRINLVRSIITRRLAAQSNKYSNLFPFFKYESRSTGMVGRIRADAISQRMDIMADQYDYRHFQTQVTRDIFLYGHAVAFPRSSWEREVQWEKKPIAVEFKSESGKIPKQARVVKEGLSWVNPHPSRLIWDNNYPLSSLNTDSGCEWVGFWDVTRWSAIRLNADYFNREAVSFSADTAALFSQYASYFNQYNYTIKPPEIQADATVDNDRKLNVGLYTGEMNDSSVFITELFVKVIPTQWRMGGYPYPIWIHLKVAGDSTVVFAEIMPSAPAAVFSLNEHDGRLTNISIAHELMGFQDQLTNLFSQLLEVTKADLFSVGIINTDIFNDSEEGKEVLKTFRQVMSGQNYYASMTVLEASFAKMAQLGISMSFDNVFKVVRSTPNTAITQIFGAIAQVVAMAERLLALSPQEQGQPAPREISATETNLIAGTTESVYSFISDAIDEGRAAQKRICYESLVFAGSDTVNTPVLTRYPTEAVTRAGFKVVDEDSDSEQTSLNITGPKNALIHDYIFTARDGGERASNSQQATVLVQLLQAIGTLQPEVQKAILSAMGKAKLLDIINEIFRKSDTGQELKLEVKPGDDDSLLMEDNEQVMSIIQRMGEALKGEHQQVEQLTQAVTEIKQMMGAPEAPPTPA